MNRVLSSGYSTQQLALSNSYLRGNIKEEIKQTTHPRFKFLDHLLLAATLTYSLILQSLPELSTLMGFMGWIYCLPEHSQPSFSLQNSLTLQTESNLPSYGQLHSTGLDF